jgi:ADP-ribosylation factor-like protein 6
MGSWFSSNKKASMIIVGLDNSGKTTIVNKLKPDEAKVRLVSLLHFWLYGNLSNPWCLVPQVNEIQATVGFSLEKFQYGNFDFTLADMAGAQKFRNLWEKIYSEVQGIIFVIDSCDEFRMVGVKYELEQMLQHEGILFIIILN